MKAVDMLAILECVYKWRTLYDAGPTIRDVQASLTSNSSSQAQRQLKALRKRGLVSWSTIPGKTAHEYKYVAGSLNLTPAGIAELVKLREEYRD